MPNFDYPAGQHPRKRPTAPRGSAQAAREQLRSASQSALHQPAPKPAVPMMKAAAKPKPDADDDFHMELVSGPREKGRRKDEEHVEQTLYFLEVRRRAAAGDDNYNDIAAVPNENFAGGAVGKYRQEEGVSPSFPDIIITQARGGYFGSYLETKEPGGGSTSMAQCEWHRRLRRRGYYVEICRGRDELMAATEWYFAKTRCSVCYAQGHGGGGGKVGVLYDCHQGGRRQKRCHDYRDAGRREQSGRLAADTVIHWNGRVTIHTRLQLA